MFSHQQRKGASLEQKDSSQKRASTTGPRSKAGLHAGLPLYLGNQPVLRLGQERVAPTSSKIQFKLRVNQRGDSHEQEADRVADQVLATSLHTAPPSIQRFSGESNGQMDVAPESVSAALASPGRPLEPALRQDMEHRFGQDFSKVRLHSGTAAEQSAQDVNAIAYTVGSDIFFGAGRFAPETREGRRLIAHELTHVVQQSAPEPAVQRQEDSREEGGAGPISSLTESALFYVRRKAVTAQHAVQSAPGADKPSQRQGTVTVRWSDDRVEFVHRLAAAVARSLRVDHEVLLTPLLMSASTAAFHFEHARSGKLKEDARLAVHVTLDYTNPGKWEASVSNVKVSDPPGATPTATQAAPATTAQVSDNPQPKPGETADQRVARQTNTSVEALSRLIEEADNLGYSGITIVIAFTGKEIEPSLMEKVGPVKPHEPGTMRMSASMAAQSIREDIMQLMMGGPGEMVIEFRRDNRGVMHHQKTARRSLPPAPVGGGTSSPRSELEMLEEYGITDPQKRWAEINKKWVAELKDAAIMVGTFALSEIATWIIGGALLKVLGRGLMRLPRLYRLIRGGKAGARAVEEGLSKLTKAEAEELGQLLKRAKAGQKLTAAEVKRLEELAARLEAELASAAVAAKTAAAANVGMSAGELAQLEAGELVFSKLVRGQTVADAMFGLEQGKLTAGILNIKTPPGADAWNSVKTFLGFKNGSMELARQLGANTLRLEGNIVRNPAVEELLRKQGFVEFSPNNFFLELPVR